MKSYRRSCDECKAHWNSMEQTLTNALPLIAQDEQKQNEQQAGALLSEMKVLFKDFKALQKEEHQIKIDKMLEEWLSNDEIYNLSCLTKDEKQSFLNISKQFMRDARAFDDRLSMDDIGQALRNVWIFIILEKIFKHPLQYHQAIFAYSMLYPYTDNYLDDMRIHGSTKKAFNEWFTSRLQGEDINPNNVYEEQISKLVGMIEEVYPRKDYPEVYEALILIQNGQKKSLLQSDIIDEAMLLDISIEKGGASVIADGYLIHGSLNDEEYQFCTEFGFLLQICDDIQDIVEDTNIKHHTLASILSKRKERIALSQQLLNYIHYVVFERCPNKDVRLLEFIERNCILLIIFSIIKNANLFTPAYKKMLQKCVPVRPNFLNVLKREWKNVTFTNSQMLEFIDYYVN